MAKTGNRKYSDEEVKHTLITAYRTYGEISYKTVQALHLVSIDFIKRNYGGLPKATEYFKLPYKDFHRNISKELLDADMYRLEREYGYVSKAIVEKHAIYKVKVINRIYGSFSNMYKELNIRRHPSGYIPTSEELVHEFWRLYDKYGNVSLELIADEAQFSATCYRDRFGSLNNLKVSLGLKPTIPGQQSNLSALYAIKKFEEYFQEKAELEKRFDWLRNSKTNRKLPLDAYFIKRHIAIEYDGPQHYSIDGRYIIDQEQLKYRQWLDQEKDRLCREHLVYVVRIPYQTKITLAYCAEQAFKSLQLWL